MNVPERIRIEEWVPQQAILNHSAVSGYVGHCGTGGTHQTLAFGKPVVCTPFMAGRSLAQPFLVGSLLSSSKVLYVGRT